MPDDRHKYDDPYRNLVELLDEFERFIQPIDDMGYREAEAAYKAVLSLWWFGNYGEGYTRRLEALQEQLADRIDGDPSEDVVVLNPDYDSE